MILENRPHDHGCLCTYNFFVSQRPAVILSENDIQIPADRMNLTEFLITSFSISKNWLKVQKRPDCWRSIRGAIAPADDITVRVQPFYESCEVYVGAPQGIEIAPASEFHDFRGLSHPSASVFWKISWFSKIDLIMTDAWFRITFLFLNVQPWYFQKMIFKYRRTGWTWQNF